MFSHIYIENDAREYELTKKIVDKFKHSRIIYIDKYKAHFNRFNQDFLAQKQNQKLILAVRRDNYLIKGSPIIQNFGLKNLHYVPLAFNCLYDCEYCYLQGLYTSANQVLFVNTDDYKKAIDDYLTQDELYICLSYDSDILAMEGVFGLGKEFIKYAVNKSNLTVELRSKSANINSLKSVAPNKNTILAWSLSPQSIIEAYEKKTPSLQARINAIQKAMLLGYRVRISLEPVLAVENWQSLYENTIDDIFKQIDYARIDSINIDQFRMSKSILRRAGKLREDSFILNDNLVEDNDLVSYPQEVIDEIKSRLRLKLLNYMPNEKIF